MTGIAAAYGGRLDMLKAIFGSGDDKTKTPKTPAGKGRLRNALRFLAGGKRK